MSVKINDGGIVQTEVENLVPIPMHFILTWVKQRVRIIVFNVSFNKFYWWGKSEYPDKSTNLSEVTDNLYHIRLY